jgi:hypothetical protein
LNVQDEHDGVTLVEHVLRDGQSVAVIPAMAALEAGRRDSCRPDITAADDDESG